MTTRRLLSNAMCNSFGFVAQFVVSFFLAPIVLNALGDTRYGVWSFLESFLAYLMLFDLGVAASLVRFVPRCIAGEDPRGLNRVYSTALVFFSGVALISGLVGWLFLQTAAIRLLSIPAELQTEARWVFLVASIHFALSLPLGVYSAMLDGLSAFAAKNGTRTAFLLLRTPVLLAVLHGEHRLLDLILVLTASNILESLVMAVIVHRRLPGLRFVPRDIDRDTIRKVRGYSLDSFLAMMAGRFSFHTDAFVIGSALGAAAITPFAFANRLVDLAKSLLRSAIGTLTPVVSTLEAQGRHGAIRSYFLHGTRLMLYLVLPIQAGLYVLGQPFLSLWIGPRHALAAGAVLWILSSTLSLTIAQSAASRVLYGLGEIRLFARMALVEGIANLLLSIGLVGPLGIVGVAWGTAIPHALFCAWVIQHACSHLQIRPGQYLREWLGPLLLTLMPTVIWLTLTASGPPARWRDLFVTGALGITPYVLSVVAIECHSRILERWKSWRAPFATST